jgi:hypothetical protein
MAARIYSREEKLKCLELELRRRQRVFAELVSQGRMRPEKARREIEVLLAIVDDYSGT